MNKIAICFSINKDYIPYFCVALKSLIFHIKKGINFDIVILHNNIDKQMQRQVYSIFPDLINLRFVNISNFVSHFDDLIFYESHHIKKETYFRLFIPRIFKNFNKVLYLDSDILILSDISELLFHELNKKSIVAAVPDIAVHNFVKNNLIINYCSQQILYKDYCGKVLKISNINGYFNAGIMLFDIQACLKFDLENKSIELLKNIKEPYFWDQDILNSVLCNKIDLLDFNFNYQQNTGLNKEKLDKKLYSKYLKAYKNIKIYHFISHLKPWNSPHLSNAHLWWHYARQTPFYEEILFKNITQNISHFNHNHANYTPQGAVEKVKTHLSYKLGKE
ncbi:glycosyltransferase family 8 protein, partial [Campylobacter jejuni]